MSKQTRRRFTGDFKSKVVLEALKERITTEELARKYELHPNQIHTWEKEFLSKASSIFEDVGTDQAISTQKKVEGLYATIGHQEMEIDFLKKKVELRPMEERQQMVDKHYPALSLSRQCDLLEIHRSGLYYSPIPESMENLMLMRLIDEQYYKTPFYGLRMVTACLKSLGHHVNKKRIKRLMDLVGWQTIFHRPRTTIAAQGHKIYPYLLRNLPIEHVNQVWAMDISYVPMKTGFMYLTAIIDLHGRYVVQWSLSTTMTAEWCAEVLKEAIIEHGVPTIFNTDQGSQFTSDVFTDILLKHDIQISMDGKGRAIDNILIERLGRSVKYEDIYLKCYMDGLCLYQGMKAYFKLYNQERLHQSLGYETPAMRYAMAA